MYSGGAHGYGGAPAYGVPGYGAPGYGTPGYGPPQGNAPVSGAQAGGAFSREGATTFARAGTAPTGPTHAAAPNGSAARQAFVPETTNEPAQQEAVIAPYEIDRRLRLVWVDGIPDEVNSDWMKKIFSSVGQVTNYYECQGLKGRVRDWGFAEYANGHEFERAVSCLDSKLSIPAVPERYPERTLRFAVDARSTRHARETQVSEVTMEDKARASSALARVLQEYVHWAAQQVIPDKEEKDVAKNARFQGMDNDTQLDAAAAIKKQLTDEDKLEGLDDEATAQIYAEIAAFRQRSQKREEATKLMEEEYEQRLAELEESARRQQEERRKRVVVEHIAVDPEIQAHEQELKRLEERLAREEADRRDDEEIEQDAREAREEALEAEYLDRERRWVNREKSRASALEREARREQRERDDPVARATEMGKALAAWDDSVEEERKTHEYYADHYAWTRHRAIARNKEQDQDQKDRKQEREEEEAASSRREAKNSEKSSTNDRQTEAAKLADTLLSESSRNKRQGLTGFSITLGGAKKANAAPQRMLRAAEKLLQDEEDDEGKSRRRPFRGFESDDEESRDHESGEDQKSRAEQLQSIAQSVPVDKDGIFAYPIKWDEISKPAVSSKIRPFVTKKIVEYLGVQEDELIDFVEEHIERRGSAEELAKELELAMEDEAALFVVKVYRYLAVLGDSSAAFK